MTTTTLSLELDMLLTHREENDLQTIAKGDSRISCLDFERRRNRELIHLVLINSRRHGSAVPLAVHQFLHSKDIGYTPLRPLRRAA